MPLGFLPEAAIDAILDYFQRPATAKASFIAWLQKRQQVATLAALPPGDGWTDDQPIISAAKAHGCFVPRAISAFDVAGCYPWAASQAMNVAEAAATSAVLDERLRPLYDDHIEAALVAFGLPRRLHNLPEESWVAPDGVIWREVNYDGLDYVLTSDGRVYFGVVSRGMELRTGDTPFYTSPPPSLAELLADLAERAKAKPPADKRRQTFIERAVDDPSILDTLNDEIDAWHNESLAAYLGMTTDEYDDWVRSPVVIHSILDRRRAARKSRAPVYADDIIDTPPSDGRMWRSMMDANGVVSVVVDERCQPRCDGAIAPPPPTPDEEPS